MAVLTWGDLASLFSQVSGAPTNNPNDNRAVFAASVAQAENSSMNPAIVSPPNKNGTVDIGLWQINSSHIGQTLTDAHGNKFVVQSQAWLQDPRNNAMTAAALSSNGTDWHPWSTAYSDNAGGTQGGTYLGKGSRAVGNFASASGETTSASGLLGTLTLGGVGSGAQLGGTSQAPSSTASNSWLVAYNDLLKGDTSALGFLNVSADVSLLVVRGGTLIVGLFLLATGLVLMAGTVILDVIFRRTSPASATRGAVVGAASSLGAS